MGSNALSPSLSFSPFLSLFLPICLYLSLSLSHSHSLSLISLILISLSPELNFINVLRSAFTLVDPKSIKRHWWLNYIFLRFWDLRAQKLYIERWWNWHLDVMCGICHRKKVGGACCHSHKIFFFFFLTRKKSLRVRKTWPTFLVSLSRIRSLRIEKKAYSTCCCCCVAVVIVIVVV